MKKFTLLFTLCAFSLVTFAQNGEDDEKEARQPVAGNHAISFGLSGLANLALNSGTDPFNNAQVLDYRNFISDGLAVRVGLGININNTTTVTENDTTGGQALVETETTNKTSAYSLGVGLEKHISTKSKTVDPYVGAGIYLSMIGKTKNMSDNKTTQPNGDYIRMVSETVTPGGIGFGVGANAGFFWFFADNIAIGAEYGLGLGFARTGGVTEQTNYTETHDASAGTTTTTPDPIVTTENLNKTTNFAVRTGSTGLINLLVTF